MTVFPYQNSLYYFNSLTMEVPPVFTYQLLTMNNCIVFNELRNAYKLHSCVGNSCQGDGVHLEYMQVCQLQCVLHLTMSACIACNHGWVILLYIIYKHVCALLCSEKFIWNSYIQWTLTNPKPH